MKKEIVMIVNIFGRGACFSDVSLELVQLVLILSMFKHPSAKNACLHFLCFVEDILRQILFIGKTFNYTQFKLQYLGAYVCNILGQHKCYYSFVL